MIRKDHTMEFPQVGGATVIDTNSHHRPPNGKEKLALVAIVFAVALLHLVWSPQADARPAGWERATASYYTLFGNRTACGKTASNRAWFVASLKRDTANCGRKVTICHRRRCVRVTVQDRGAWRSDNRRWDLQPRVKRALRCGDLCSVRWRRGWATRR